MRHHTRPVSARTAPLQRSVTRPPSSRSSSRARPEGGCADAAGAQTLVVEVRQDLPRPRVEVAGELDLEGAGLLSAMIDHVRVSRQRAGTADLHPGEVDVDLTGVTFADSHGMAPVLDGRTRIVAVSEPVRRLLHLLREPSGSAGRPQPQPRPA